MMYFCGLPVDGLITERAYKRGEKENFLAEVSGITEYM